MLKRNKIIYIFLPLFALPLNNIDRVNSYDRHVVKEENHDYEEGLGVELLMHTVGPYNNPQETYDYFSLPFCKGNWEIEDLCEHLICKKCKCCKCPEKKESNETRREGEFNIAFYGPMLGKPGGLEMHFKVDQPKREYCSKRLTEAEADAFTHAIQNTFWYQMSIDSLPIHAFVGEMDVLFYIYTHRRIEIGYNGPNIVSVDVFAEEKRQIKRNLTISFTYEVRWNQSEVPFGDRSHRYLLDHSFVEFRDHRLSKFFSIIIIIFLLVRTISIANMSSTNLLAHLKIKRREQNEFHRDLDEPCDDWNFIRDRIFRTPACPLIFSSLVGNGGCIIFMLLPCIAMAPYFDTLPSTNPDLLSCLTIFYFMTGGLFTGCFVSFFYKLMGGKHRLQQAIFGILLLFPVIWYSVVFGVNLVAIESQVSRAVPVKQMLFTMLLLSAFFVPMYAAASAAIAFGGKKERNVMFKDQEKKAEVHTTAPAAGPKPKVDRDGFPAGPYFIALFGGFIIFSSIFADLNFIFARVWSYKVFYLFWYLLLIDFIIVTVMSACVGIVATYLMLKARDYSRWCWTSFTSGASVALYILSYAIYYYFYESKMSGLFQTSFYIGYNFLFAIILAFFCGTMSFLVSLIFIDVKFFELQKEFQ